MKTRKNYRKLIALLLSIVTIVGCLSGVTAFAEENDNTPTRGTLINGLVNVPSNEINFGKGGAAIANTDINVYSDVTLNNNSNLVGIILEGEGFTIIANDTNTYPNYCIKVEFNTAYGPQQGYINQNANFIHTTSIYHNLAHVNVSSASVYYGAESGYYQSFGTVYYGEFVAVLGISVNNGRTFIEYNAANGERKRGYVSTSALYFFGTIDDGTPFENPTNNHQEQVGQYVRSGPSEEYPIIGLINDGEWVNIKEQNPSYYFDGYYWKYITYAVSGTSYYKAGYIKVL